MSIEPGEHCGHVCCPTPHEPHHDHFLSTADCPRCRAIADEVSTSWKEVERLKVQLRTLENARKLGIPMGTNNPLLLALGAAPPVGYNISDAAPGVSEAGGCGLRVNPPLECQQEPPHGTADVGVVSGLPPAPTPTDPLVDALVAAARRYAKVWDRGSFPARERRELCRAARALGAAS